jgi:hypothetical protein
MCPTAPRREATRCHDLLLRLALYEFTQETTSLVHQRRKQSLSSPARRAFPAKRRSSSMTSCTNKTRRSVVFSSPSRSTYLPLHRDGVPLRARTGSITGLQGTINHERIACSIMSYTHANTTTRAHGFGGGSTATCRTARTTNFAGRLPGGSPALSL